jgi:hypothetical protein
MWSMVSLLLPGFERLWLIIGAEYSPLWTGVYAGLAGQPVSRSAVAHSAWSLRRWALDLIDWPVDHSNRWDAQVEPFHARDSDMPIIREILPPAERVMGHWNNDPYALQAGSGTNEQEPAVWRLPYYLMAYYKLI